MIDILEDDNLFIKYQLSHYFKNDLNDRNKFSYVDAINKTHKFTQTNKNSLIIWIEIIWSPTDIEIFFNKDSNCQNIMSDHKNILKDYNSDIIKRQTNLICSSIEKFPYLVIRTGWDMLYCDINEPCLLRVSRRINNINDCGTIIPDSSTQAYKLLCNYNSNIKINNYHSKISQLVWRGTNSGIGYKNISKILELNGKSFNYLSRGYFIKLFNKKYDVGFVIYNKNSDSEYTRIEDKTFIKDFIDNITIGENYKFMIALDGNSFAGSFGWNLLSNSVVFHPEHNDSIYTYVFPRKNIDYIPINDQYSDLDEKITYYKNNDFEASNIASNGRKYMLKLLKNTPILTHKTFKLIYNMYDQNTFNEALKILHQKFTSARMKLVNGKYIL